jgi:cold-inducible RNA-binding protein
MNIYVGNLTLETTEEELRREFTPFGEVLSVRMMDDKYIGSGQPIGYGYVEMASKSEGAAAIAALRGKILRNRLIEIVEALPLDKSGTASFSRKINSPFHSKVRQRRY